MPEPTHHSPAKRSTAGRIAAIVASGLVALFALGFLGVGAALLWADGKKDEQGYVSTGTDRYATDTAAIATSSLDVDLDGAGGIVGSNRFGKLRLKVTTDGGKPVFVGIARRSDVSEYLRGTAHSTLTDVDYSPFHADYRETGGQRVATPPSEQRIWAASATGSGTQSLRWDVTDGTWSIVVMNADGSPGVDVGVSAGAKVPHLAAFAWGAAGIGTVLLVLAGGLLFLGVRDPSPRTPTATTPDAALVTAG